MDELDRLADWMRRNGAIEASFAGTSIRFAEVPPLPATSEAQAEGESTPESRPPARAVPGMCRSCGNAPPIGIYAARQLCRECGWKDVSGEAA